MVLRLYLMLYFTMEAIELSGSSSKEGPSCITRMNMTVQNLILPNFSIMIDGSTTNAIIKVIAASTKGEMCTIDRQLYLFFDLFVISNCSISHITFYSNL